MGVMTHNFPSMEFTIIFNIESIILLHDYSNLISYFKDCYCILILKFSSCKILQLHSVFKVVINLWQTKLQQVKTLMWEVKLKIERN